MAGDTADIPKGHTERMCVSLEPARLPEGGNEGLVTAYAANSDKYHFLRKLMCLPYLPSEHFVPAFEKLKLQAEKVCIFLFQHLFIIQQLSVHLNKKKILFLLSKNNQI
ncbi:hypothetical protein DPMN_182638 [Dreissena polymorpha]|uniref:Uncharacterized protein n=1 Tax=Dreissena polymorpha TaxID=45954 RepID=A0A9D4DGN1_DREPO|nr:hypothetical protein DPMN_182638 [Dreissena polymorpha]